jgi:hypothetical protein
MSPGPGSQIEQDNVGGIDSKSGQGVRERLGRDLRRAALQELASGRLELTMGSVVATNRRRRP